jgi:quercetin dioxygenase-like cupin family protein
MKKITSILLFAAALAIYSFAFALDQQPAAKTEHTVFAAADLKWSDGPPSLPAGAKVAVLNGDPKQPGAFTIRLQFPTGFKVPPHTHPTAEHVTVISGTLGLGHGAKFDEAAVHEMTAGGFAVMPAGMEHFAWCKSECVVQVHAMGPFEIKYVNPADDPRQAKK